MRLRCLPYVVVSKRWTNCEKSCDESCVLVEHIGVQWAEAASWASSPASEPRLSLVPIVLSIL